MAEVCQVTVGWGSSASAYFLEGQWHKRGACFSDSLLCDTGGSFDLSHQRGRGGVRTVGGRVIFSSGLPGWGQSNNQFYSKTGPEHIP